MGFDQDCFVDESKISSQLECVICREVLDRPVMTKCEHLYCEGCLLEWLTAHDKCPTCCAVLDPREIKKAPRIVRNMLNELEMRCQYVDNGCKWAGALEKYKGHLLVCKHSACCVLPATAATAPAAPVTAAPVTAHAAVEPQQPAAARRIPTPVKPMKQAAADDDGGGGEAQASRVAELQGMVQRRDARIEKLLLEVARLSTALRETKAKLHQSDEARKGTEAKLRERRQQMRMLHSVFVKKMKTSDVPGWAQAMGVGPNQHAAKAAPKPKKKKKKQKRGGGGRQQSLPMLAK